MEQDGKLDLDALDEITDRVLAYRPPRPQAPKKKQPARERRLYQRPPPVKDEDESEKPEC